MRVVEGRSDGLDERHGRFKAVLIGRAFHWMDREQTLRTLTRLIEPGGAVVLIAEELPKLPENARMEQFQEFDRAWSAGDTTHPILQVRERPHISMLLASPFSRLEQISVIQRHPLTLQILCDRMLSYSSTSRASLGDRADDMLAELSGKFAEWERQGPMEEVLELTALMAFRPI